MDDDADEIAPHTFSYGAHPAQFVEVHLPPGAGPHPVVILIHGGFWRLPWDLDLMRPLAHDLVLRDFATVNVEYRRLGEEGGGWPDTCQDVLHAVNHALHALPQLPETSSLDPSRTALVGHSAGGHLALWAASHLRGHVAMVVSQAGVVDLRAASRDRLDEQAGKAPAATEFMHGELPEAPAYGLASPIELLPLGSQVFQLVVHGDADNRVPFRQSLDYVEAAEVRGDDVRLAAFTGMGHFELIDPTHESWRTTTAELTSHLKGHA